MLQRKGNANLCGRDGQPCIHAAISGHHLDVLKSLLVHHADANALDLEDATPLQVRRKKRSSEHWSPISSKSLNTNRRFVNGRRAPHQHTNWSWIDPPFWKWRIGPWLNLYDVPPPPPRPPSIRAHPPFTKPSIESPKYLGSPNYSYAQGKLAVKMSWKNPSNGDASLIKRRFSF